MPILTPSEVSTYTSISGTVTTASIQAVQDNINLITNNYFVTDLYIQGTMTFDSSARTIIAGANWSEYGFNDTDEIYIYNSYRNDGYKQSLSVSTTTLTLATTESVYSERSGRTVLVSVVQWPRSLKQVAAQMVAYDVDQRDSVSANVKSHSLGPFSETFTSGNEDEFGYPRKITNKLAPFTIARLR